MYLGIPIVCLMPIIAYHDHRSSELHACYNHAKYLNREGERLFGVRTISRTPFRFALTAPYIEEKNNNLFKRADAS